MSEAATDTATKTATKTKYHVLVKSGDGYDFHARDVEAPSGTAAIRKTVTETGTYVAIPSRSFVPTKVTLTQQTVVTLG